MSIGCSFFPKLFIHKVGPSHVSRQLGGKGATQGEKCELWWADLLAFQIKEEKKEGNKGERGKEERDRKEKRRKSPELYIALVVFALNML